MQQVQQLVQIFRLTSKNTSKHGHSLNIKARFKDEAKSAFVVISNTCINPVMNSGISNTHMFKMLKQIQLLSFALEAGE